MTQASEQDPRAYARRLAAQSIAAGDDTGWFERLYADAAAGRATVPWADLEPNPNLVEWSEREALQGSGRRALVVGCGFGDDAVFVERRGFDVTAFDVSPTAIARARFRARVGDWESSFVVADLLAAPQAWAQAYDFVFEAYTVQTLQGDARRRAIEAVGTFVAPGGTLLVVARARMDDEDPGSMPWPLTKAEAEAFETGGLEIEHLELYYDAENTHSWRIELRRA